MRPRFGARIGLGLVLLLASGCAGPRAAPPDGPDALSRLLAPLGVEAGELGIRDVEASADRWHLRAVDLALEHPFGAVGGVRGMAADLDAPRGSLGKMLRRAARLADAPIGGTPDEDGARAADLDALPPRLRGVVLDLLAAAARATPLIVRSSAGLSFEEREFLLRFLGGDAARTRPDESAVWRFVDLASRPDRVTLLAGAAIVADAVDRAVARLKRWDEPLGVRTPQPAWQDVATGDVVLVADTAGGRVVVGGPGPTTYTGEALLVIDLGGDDRYLGRAGGARGPDAPVAVVIDLGGNDRYVAPGDVAQGAGALGVGVLVDLGGHDTYLARSVAQGAGLFGVGLLVDHAGDDRYEAVALAQGAAAFGAGLLVDASGTDVYRATARAQGFGATAGVGALLEKAGDDRYILANGAPEAGPPLPAGTLGQGFALGVRPLASGGIGLLIDRHGNDRYAGEEFAQGASYWRGLGALVDDEGDDEYVATRYAQGTGAHLGAGVLWDGAGHDRYRALTAAQGMGHDYGLGVLADARGDDRYTAGWLAQGVGSIDGLGMLVDAGGNDWYQVQAGDSQGYGGSSRRSQSFGFLMDLGGEDAYTGPGFSDRTWSGGEYGGGIDGEGLRLGFSLEPRGPDLSAPASSPVAFEHARPADPSFRPRDAVEERVQRLLVQVSDASDTIDAARARDQARLELNRLGAEAVPSLLRLLASLDVALVNQAVAVLAGMGEAAHPVLIERLDDPAAQVRRRAAFVIAQRPTPAAARALLERARRRDEPALRAFAAEAVARACLPEAREVLAGLLAGDPALGVRYAAARGLALLGGPVEPFLLRALDDPAFQVRLAARKALAGPRSAACPVGNTHQQSGSRAGDE